MSSYRRFISYMHQYTNGQKGMGCGFVKAELRNNTCSLLFQLKNLPVSTPFTLAFFLPDKDSVTFIPIWSGSCPNGCLNMRFTTDSLHLFNTNYAFRQCCGIILSKKEEVICGCCWNEKMHVPKRFFEASVKTSSAISSETDAVIPAKTDFAIPVIASSAISSETASKTHDELTKPQPVPNTLPSQEPAHKNSQKNQTPAPSVPSPAAVPPKETPRIITLTFEELWKQMQEKYPPLDPFEEGGIVEGIKISPADLPVFDFLPLNISSNRFLLHGYKTYKHLLLGRMEGQNRYILGIPGVYDSQEEFMAKMFGFPCFKPIRPCMKPVGQFGYWFRCIRA